MRVRQRELPPEDPRHGTVNGYSNYRCRCLPCRDAHSAYQVELRAHWRKRGLPPGDPRHGTFNGYDNYGCRCVMCDAAATLYNHARYQRARNRRLAQQ